MCVCGLWSESARKCYPFGHNVFSDCSKDPSQQGRSHGTLRRYRKSSSRFLSGVWAWVIHCSRINPSVYSQTCWVEVESQEFRLWSKDSGSKNPKKLVAGIWGYQGTVGSLQIKTKDWSSTCLFPLQGQQQADASSTLNILTESVYTLLSS